MVSSRLRQEVQQLPHVHRWDPVTLRHQALDSLACHPAPCRHRGQRPAPCLHRPRRVAHFEPLRSLLVGVCPWAAWTSTATVAAPSRSSTRWHTQGAVSRRRWWWYPVALWPRVVGARCLGPCRDHHSMRQQASSRGTRRLPIPCTLEWLLLGSSTPMLTDLRRRLQCSSQLQQALQQWRRQSLTLHPDRCRPQGLPRRPPAQRRCNCGNTT